MPKSRVCSVEGCGKPSYSRGMCNMHYRRWKKHGDACAGGTSPGSALHFAEEVALLYRGDDCLLWPFKPRASNAGYGRFQLSGQTVNAHRFVCESAHGQPPTSEHEAAHSCGNARCVNPRHLRWATPRENCADMILHGTIKRGRGHYKTKLAESDVRRIRTLIANGETNYMIAKQFGVHEGTVRSIRLRKSWGWLP